MVGASGYLKTLMFFWVTVFCFLICGYTDACTISTTPVGFSNYAVNQSNPVYGSGAVNLTCTNSIPYYLEIDDGSYSSGYLLRRMSNGGNYISYQLFRDNSYIQNWGTAADGMTGLTGTGSLQSYTIYGKVPGYQNIPAGLYSDIAVVTVTY